MSDKRKDSRVYTWVVKNPVPIKSKECKEFRDYVQKLVNRAKRLLEYDTNRFNADCYVYIKMECYPTGKSGPNRLRRDLFKQYPEANTDELSRER